MQNCRSAGDIIQSPVLLRWLPSLLPRPEDQAAAGEPGLSRIPIRAGRLALATGQRRQLRQLWVSPLMLLIGLVVVFAFFCVVVVPPLQDFFTECGLEISRSTKVVFLVSQWVNSMPIWLLVAIGVSLLTSLAILSCPPTWIAGWLGPVDALIQRGTVTRQVPQASLAHDLADLISAGVESQAAQDFAIERFLYGNTSFATEFSPGDRLRGIGMMPAPLRQLVGMESDHELKLSDAGLLRAWANIYDNRILHVTTRRLVNVVRGFMHLLFGWVVLVMVVAIYGPIVQLIQGLT
jgi:type II secretory pathway component PulF